MRYDPHFRRGQVWYVDDNYKSIGSIQGKSRPYVVVSNDACNRFSPVIHMAPITSKDKKNHLPTHVLFYNPRQKQNNIILVEQTMPKSAPDIIDVSDYQYSLPAEVMQEIDKALAIQFALKSFGVDISEFETMLDMIVEQKIAQIQDATQSLLDARMAKYVNALLDRVSEAGKIPDPKVYVPNPIILQQMQYAPATALPQQDEDVTTSLPEIQIDSSIINTSKEESISKHKKVDRPKSAIDRFNAKWGTSFNTSVENPTKDKLEPTSTKIERPEIIRLPSGRIRWTDELKNQFIIDMASYEPRKVSDLWGLDQKCLLSYRYRFTKDLNEVKSKSKQVSKSEIDNEASTTIEPTVKRRPGRPKKSKVVQCTTSSTEDILHDYDEMPISKFMEKYGIATRAQAVEFAAKLRVG